MSEPISDEDDEHGDLPSLTLIFTTSDKENADWDRLLDLADHAYYAIERVDPRFSILKSFTFYAGADHMSQAEKLAAAESRLAAAEDVVGAARVFAEKHGRFHPDFWVAARSDKFCDACDFGAALALYDSTPPTTTDHPPTSEGGADGTL